ncbi:hypothetical protein PC128_g27082 [Phytophthora cactorum]|nr:hypothetical protein PC128_g27082 [Phytophthora cactorum]
MSAGETRGAHLGPFAESSCPGRLLEVNESSLRLRTSRRRPRQHRHLAPVPDTVTGEHAARQFVDGVFRHHGLPETFNSDRDPRFTTAFWQTLFRLLGTSLHMSTADHPQTDGQTERVNRVLEDTLRSVCAEAPRTWSERLPVVEFALNNAVHASTGFTPFYLNGMHHPRVPLTLRGGTEASILSGGEARKALSSQVSDLRPVSLRKQVESFIDTRLM